MGDREGDRTPPRRPPVEGWRSGRVVPLKGALFGGEAEGRWRVERRRVGREGTRVLSSPSGPSRGRVAMGGGDRGGFLTAAPRPIYPHGGREDTILYRGWDCTAATIAGGTPLSSRGPRPPTTGEDCTYDYRGSHVL